MEQSKHRQDDVYQKPHAPKEWDIWYFPPDIAYDLDGINLPQSTKGEILATAFEYTRVVVPCYTNWSRYVAFMRIIVMGIVAEFKGEMIDISVEEDKVLNYSLSGVLSDLFAGTPGHADMAREFKTFLLVSGDKSSSRRNGELFRRYVNSLADSPENYFRMRDTDALCRFTIASALACNDKDDVWFTEEQFDLLAELGDTMYDAVAYFKHRSEGETNNTFAYVPANMRIFAFKQCREILWALDAAWGQRSEMACVTNFLRYFGGPLHMVMRRYRFVEEDMTIGREEDAVVVDQTRNNFKLWNRIDVQNRRAEESESAEVQRYRDILDRRDSLLFAGLAERMEEVGDGHCDTCLHRASYGAETIHCFGGVQLCDICRPRWGEYIQSLPERATKVFPELVAAQEKAISSDDMAGRKPAHDQVLNGSA